MPSLIKRVTTTVGGAGCDQFHECRRCGTRVDDDAETCPECGAADIAHHELS
jgi:rubrerythrin